MSQATSETLLDIEGVYTILEFWDNRWWRWYMKNGKPIAFIEVGR